MLQADMRAGRSTEWLSEGGTKSRNSELQAEGTLLGLGVG